jgi:general secretion pathway protein A
MYSKHFGFEELPFNVTPDPRFFYDTPVYQDVLAGLQHGIATKSAFIVVTGEAGTGKTTLLRRLIYDSPGTIDYAFVNIRPRLSLLALLRAILKELKVSSSSMDQQDLLDELGSCALDRFTKGRTVAFLFDESQGLSDELLLELPVLWNLAIESEKLIPIVLTGQQELDKRLNSSKLRGLAQHITLRRQLMPFPDNDVGPYIATRLEHVGYRGNDLFEPAAIDRLINRSSGIPRLINSICDNALLSAYRASQYKVTAAMIDEIASQLRLPVRSPRAKPPEEVANLFRLIDRTLSGDRKRTDATANQPRFVESLLDTDPKKTDEVASQPRFVDRPPTLDQEKIPEAADAPRFVGDPAPSVDQKKSGEIIDQPRFADAIPNAEQKRMDEDIDPLRFVDHSASADQKSMPEVDQPQDLEKSFSAESLDPDRTIDDAVRKESIQPTPPKQPENFLTPSPTMPKESGDAADAPAIVDRDQLGSPGLGQSQNSEERPSAESVEASNRSDNLAKDKTEQLAPSRIDQPQNIAAYFSTSSAEAVGKVGPLSEKVGDQPAPSQTEQPQNPETSFSEFETDKALDDTGRKPSDQFIYLIYQMKLASWRNYQLLKANRLKISIGALIVLVGMAAGLAVFYPRQRDAAVPGKRYAENLSRETNKTAAPAMPVDNVKNNVDVSDKKLAEAPPQPALAAPPPSLDVSENRDQDRDTQKTQTVVEGADIAKTTPESQDIYRVTGASFLRRKPTANAEIIETLHPGMRIVVTNRSGEYLSVRSFDGKVSGFVHKEDAFFERLRK